MAQLAAAKATVLAIDALPRTLSRAQKMDADLDGRCQRLPRGGGSGQRIWALLQRPDHGCGQRPRQGVHCRCRCGWPRGAIGAAASLGAIVRANDTRAEVADRWCRWAANL